MAKKRMFTTQITDSDDFIAMSSAAQALYLHLNNGADDDGFNNQVQMAMYKAHASIDDLKILLAKRFVLQFDSGVIVIKHWRMANSLRKDRYTPTVFQEELSQLGLKDNGSYTWLPNGCQMVATDKVSIDKNSKDYLYIPEVDPEEDPEKESKSELYKRIINYLNEKTGKHFRVGNEVTRLIDARLNAKASEQDFYTVIDNMCSKWLDDEKMNEYLRPITLFGSKFDSYLNTTPRRTYDVLPVYDTSNNQPISEEEKRELLRLMGREDDEPTTNDKNSG